MNGKIGVNQMTTALVLATAPSKCAYLPKSTHLTLSFQAIFWQLSVRTALVAVDSPFVRASNMPAFVPAGPCLNNRNK
jgi:hypothetical protein